MLITPYARFYSKYLAGTGAGTCNGTSACKAVHHGATSRSEVRLGTGTRVLQISMPWCRAEIAGYYGGRWEK